MTFYKKYSGKIFFAKYFGWAKHLFGPVPLNFSTRKELDSDLNAGGWGVQGQSYGKISEEARKGPK